MTYKVGLLNTITSTADNHYDLLKCFQEKLIKYFYQNLETYGPSFLDNDIAREILINLIKNDSSEDFFEILRNAENSKKDFATIEQDILLKACLRALNMKNSICDILLFAQRNNSMILNISAALIESRALPFNIFKSDVLPQIGLYNKFKGNELDQFYTLLKYACIIYGNETDCLPTILPYLDGNPKMKMDTLNSFFELYSSSFDFNSFLESYSPPFDFFEEQILPHMLIDDKIPNDVINTVYSTYKGDNASIQSLLPLIDDPKISVQIAVDFINRSNYFFGAGAKKAVTFLQDNLGEPGFRYLNSFYEGAENKEELKKVKKILDAWEKKCHFSANSDDSDDSDDFDDIEYDDKEFNEGPARQTPKAKIDSSGKDVNTRKTHIKRSEVADRPNQEANGSSESRKKSERRRGSNWRFLVRSFGSKRSDMLSDCSDVPMDLDGL